VSLNLVDDDDDEHRGLAEFPMTRDCPISPVMNPHKNMVSRFFESFPPEHFSSFKQRVLFGSAWKNNPVSSQLAMSFGS
jgi:hypothetical protein